MAEIIISNTVSSGFVLNDEGDKMHVRIGGTVSDTKIYSGATIHVSEGGLAADTYIYSSGFMYVSEGGITTGTHLRPSAWMEIFSGGTANSTIVDSKSTLIVYNGGTATITYNPWGGNVLSSAGAVVSYLERDAGIYYGGNDAGLVSSGDAMTGLIITENNSAVVFGENNAYLNGNNVKTANAGILTNAKVNSRAHLHISNGGLASNTTVRAGGNMFVSSGGSADVAAVSGNIVVSRGGSINSVTVRGSMNLQDGGSATKTTVTAGAKINGISLTTNETFAKGLDIHGGKVDGNDAYLYSNQSASNTTINDTGTLHISSGGKLVNASIIDTDITKADVSATVIVSNGGSAESTLVKGNRVGIGQTWTSRVLALTETFPYSHHITSTWNTDNAYLVVKSGGSAINTTVNYNGTLRVLSSGYAAGVKVQGATWSYWNLNSSGIALLFESGADSAYIHADGGTVYGADINTFGYMYVYNNGLADSAFVNNNGNMEVKNNGSALHTSIFAGGKVDIISGGNASATTVYSRGTMQISSGGYAVGTVISSGGKVSVNGGVVEKTMIMSSGTMTVQSGAQVGNAGSVTDKMWWNNGIIVNSDGVLNVQQGATAYVIYNPWGGTVISEEGATVHYQTIDEVTGVYYGGQAPGLVTMTDSMTRLEITSGYSAMVFREGELTEVTLNEKNAYLHVYNGGKITNVNAVTSSIINGFTLQSANYYNSGIHISNAYIGSRTMGTLYNGQTATNVTVNLHGSLYIEGGAKITSSFFDSGAVINGFTISESNKNANAIHISSAVASSGTSAFVFAGQTVKATSAQAGVILNGFTLQQGNYYENNLTLSNGLTESGNKSFIYSGQTASSNTVAAGGHFTVCGGGMAYATTLQGSMTVSMAAYVSGVNITSGGSMSVSNGAHVANLKVNTGARVTLASGAVINGFLLQRANTYTNNIIISSAIVKAGITTELYEGINAKGITINTSGKMFVSDNGWTSNTTVLSAGELHISSGGKAITTTISKGGIVHVFSGATASATDLLSGGYLGVGNGGNIYKTTVNSGGALTVYMGGSAVSNTIMSAGNIFVSYGAHAKENSIASGGGLHIYSGGIASATSIAQGAFLGVGNGGIAISNTVASCGEVIVWGGGLVDTNSVDTWGAIILSSGAAANFTTVNSNAGLHIYSGAVAYSTEVTRGARLGVGLGGVLFNADATVDSEITLYDGAVLRGWNEFSGSVEIKGEVDATGSYLVFDLIGRSNPQVSILNNAEAVKEAQFFLTKESCSVEGQYILAGNAAGFLGMTIGLAGTDIQLDIGGATAFYNGRSYTAGVTNGELWVDIRTSYINNSLMDYETSESSIPEDAVSCLTGAADSLEAVMTAGALPLEGQDKLLADCGTSFLAVM